MKKLIWILIAAAVAGTALQGCGAMGKPADSAQQAEAQSSSVPESEPSESRLSPGGSSGISVPESRESVSTVSESTVSESRLSESAITGPMALKGVRNYCGSAYGLSTDDGQTADINLEIDDVTDSVYQLSYLSYTGAVVKFYVDRTTGLTRVTEYAPGLDVENDAGTFSILDYQDEAHQEGVNANGKYHHISRYIFTAFEFHYDGIAFIFKSRNTVTKIQFHSVFTDMFMQNLCHFKIKRCHDLLCGFYQTDFQTCMTKIFRHFNSDKTAADDSGIFHFAALYK